MSNIEKTLQQIIYSLNDVHVGIHLLSKQLVMNSEQVQLLQGSVENLLKYFEKIQKQLAKEKKNDNPKSKIRL